MIRQPASVIIAGPSRSGKSEFVEQLLKEKKIFFPLQKRSCIVMIADNQDLIAWKNNPRRNFTKDYLQKEP